MTDYMEAKRAFADKQAAAAARVQVAEMIAREKQRRQTPPSPELSHTDIDATRIAYIGVHEWEDGFKSDVFVLPQDPGAPLIAVPCPFDVAEAANHYNQLGNAQVALIYSKMSRAAVNINTIARLETTPNAITSALVFWKTSDAPGGVPVDLSEPQIHAIQAQLADTDTERAVAKLRAMAEQGLVERHKPTAAQHQLAG